MSSAIVKYQPIINNVDDLQRVARMYALSAYFDAKGDGHQAIAQIATKIMAGQELGYGPFTSVNGIHVIQGKPSLSANLMAAAVKAHPHYNYKVREMTDKNVSIEFFEDGESIGKSEFSIEDARKAKTQNLDKFPRNMLFARALSNGVKWYCPDVFNGNAVYTPEELGADVDDEGEYIAASNNGYRQIEQTKAPVAVESTKRSESEQQPEALHPTVAEWLNADNPAKAAQAWAIEIGAQSSEHSARNSMKKIVTDQFSGKFTDGNKNDVLTAYFHRQQEHLAELADAVEAVNVDVAEPVLAQPSHINRRVSDGAPTYSEARQ